MGGGRLFRGEVMVVANSATSEGADKLSEKKNKKTKNKAYQVRILYKRSLLLFSSSHCLPVIEAI